MDNKKFLTVMAVFDDKTQKIMHDLQDILIKNVGEGTQTMGIPFHVTLGSFATYEIEKVIEKIDEACAAANAFELDFLGQGSFGDKVLFLDPEKAEELVRLRSYFENDYAHGYEWVPHATLFCGSDGQVQRAREILRSLDLPSKAKIVGIELGEFFPAEKKYSVTFKKGEI